jgi:lysophospholipase L1-like esterase
MLKHLRSKTLMTVSFVFVFLFSMVGTAFAYGGTYTSTSSTSYDYLAVGDSVAWGFVPDLNPPLYGHPDTSYTDIIADNLDNASVLGSYNETYQYPGMPTKALLAALLPHANGTTIPVNGYTATLPNYLPLMADIKKAEMITLTVGADDLWFLPEVQKYANGFNPADLSAAQAAVLKQLPKTGANLSLIIGIMKAANPKARIYVMGYYNALPNTPAESLVKLLNAAIYSSVNNYRYSLVAPRYVGTWDAVTVPGNLYPNNIHVTLAGQQEIATAFWLKINNDFHITP